MAKSKGSKHSSRDVHPSVDRISALPDSLICHILSFLPTHYAVQTTILSKRWIDLWTFLTSLDFDDESFVKNNNKNFKYFVYRVLVLLKTPCLHKFNLIINGSLSGSGGILSKSFHEPNYLHVETWVSAALSRNVRELGLIINESELFDPFDIPISLFTCKTLSYLSLSNDLMLDVSNSVYLPNLKYLSLSLVQYANDESVQMLLSGCPVLEKLFIKRYLCEFKEDNVVQFCISSPTLKFLDLDFLSDRLPDNPRHTLEIDTPMLQYLFLHDHHSSDFVIGNLSSLVKANIDFYDYSGVYDDDIEFFTDENEYGDNVLKLFNGLSHVKFLQLSGATLEVLSYAHEFVADSQNMAKVEGDFSTSNQESWSINPERVPKCWLSHLTTVEITAFYGSTNELMMVKFILKGAKLLEKMTIIAGHPEIKSNLLQEITKFPRGSQICELLIS